MRANSSKKLFKALAVNVYWKDLTGKYIGCNDVSGESVDLTPQDLIGKTDADLFSPEIAAIYRKNDERVVNEKTTIVFDESISGREPESEEQFFISSKSPLYAEDGQIIGIIGVSINVTKIRRLEMNLRGANRKLKTISDRAREKHGRFLQDQQHDILTPLLGIAWTAQSIESLVSDKTVKEFAGDLVLSADELQDYNRTLLRNLEWQSGDGIAVKRRFDCKQMLERVFNLNVCAAKMKSLEYSCSFDDCIPQYLMSDGLCIYQSLQNLISNAINFTETGRVVVSANCLKHDKEKGIVVVEFCVEDIGIGVSPEEQREIFEAFTKVKPSNKGGQRGRGLGLFLTHQYVKAMSGELNMVSAPEKGSKVSFVLPLDVSLDQESSERFHIE